MIRQLGVTTTVLCFLSIACGTLLAADPQPNLKQLTLEQLMDVEITSVAKKEQRVGDTAAAIYVITQEEIRRSGVTSIPEALRLAPGVTVSRINSNQWAIGVRGFGTELSRSVLVLIDGRSVYAPLFAGVYWDIQDTMLEDIDRIEVIRGPGGTIWGANAVNGVINIITKDAKDTQGLLVNGGGGTEERNFLGARYGWKIGDDISARVYAKGFRRDAQFTPHVSDFDSWQKGQGGFRTDWDLNKDNNLTIQGDLYEGNSGLRQLISKFTAPFSKIVTKDADVSGMNLLGRWRRTLSETSDLTLQAYYDRTFHREPRFQEERNTVDFDFQHRFRLTAQQELIWGLGYRYSRGDTDSLPTVIISPQNRGDNLFSAFIQDEVRFFQDAVRLTMGSKFEHNDYSGFEFQPSARVLWKVAEQHSLWASVSRAVRTPTRVDEDIAVSSAPFPGLPLFTRILGNKDFKPEKVIAYELGYRVQPTERFFVDLAAFYNHYDDLLSADVGTLFVEPPGLFILPFKFNNRFKAAAYGGELAADWRWLDWWRWRFSYSRLHINLTKKRGNTDLATEQTTEGSSPQNQVAVTAFIDLPGNFQFDGSFRYIDSLPAQSVGRYFNLDLRLGWHATKNLELSLVGQNLLQGHHAEWSGGTQIQRGVYTKAEWRW